MSNNGNMSNSSRRGLSAHHLDSQGNYSRDPSTKVYYHQSLIPYDKEDIIEAVKHEDEVIPEGPFIIDSVSIPLHETIERTVYYIIEVTAQDGAMHSLRRRYRDFDRFHARHRGGFERVCPAVLPPKGGLVDTKAFKVFTCMAAGESSIDLNRRRLGLQRYLQRLTRFAQTRAGDAAERVAQALNRFLEFYVHYAPQVQATLEEEEDADAVAAAAAARAAKGKKALLAAAPPVVIDPELSGMHQRMLAKMGAAEEQQQMAAAAAAALRAAEEEEAEEERKDEEEEEEEDPQRRHHRRSSTQGGGSASLFLAASTIAHEYDSEPAVRRYQEGEAVHCSGWGPGLVRRAVDFTDGYILALRDCPSCLRFPKPPLVYLREECLEPADSPAARAWAERRGAARQRRRARRARTPHGVGEVVPAADGKGGLEVRLADGALRSSLRFGPAGAAARYTGGAGVPAPPTHLSVGMFVDCPGQGRGVVVGLGADGRGAAVQLYDYRASVALFDRAPLAQYPVEELKVDESHKNKPALHVSDNNEENETCEKKTLSVGQPVILEHGEGIISGFAEDGNKYIISLYHYSSSVTFDRPPTIEKLVEKKCHGSVPNDKATKLKDAVAM